MISPEFLASLVFADATNTRKTQEFGYTTFGATKYIYGFHTGVDLVTTSINDYIVSPCDAEVTALSKGSTGYGYSLVAKFQSQYLDTKSQWYSYRLGHLEPLGFADGLSVGSKIQKGQVLGKMGSTGNSTGEHLHLEIFRGVQNPYEFKEDRGRFTGAFIDPRKLDEITNIYKNNLMVPSWEANSESNRLVNALDPDTRRMVLGAIANRDLNYLLHDLVAAKSAKPQDCSEQIKQVQELEKRLNDCKDNEADTEEERILLKVWGILGPTVQKTITDIIGFGVAGFAVLELAGVSPVQFLPENDLGKVIAAVAAALGLYIRNKSIPKK